jgi:hypothetical protein
MIHPMRAWVLIALAFAGCGGSDESSENAPPSGPPAAAADISLLFMGNSHTSSNDLTGMVGEMVRAVRPGRTVAFLEAPGWMFLEERITHVPSTDLLRSQNWSFVILQAQKYSTSGLFEYSTAEAEEFIRRSRQQRAVPIMFPEWPRRGIDETSRIYDLHVSIAQREMACVAPIGQAWDLSLQRHPQLALHAADGNHSNPAGAFLAALMLFATITGVSPADLPALPRVTAVDASTQALLRAIAAETVQVWPPHAWCPSDPFA